MRIVELKVKIVSLAAESAIIRREERRAKRKYRWAMDKVGNEEWPNAAATLKNGRETFWSLRRHRVGTQVSWMSDKERYGLRGSARSALIAYAYLRGRSYAQTEPPGSSKPHWPEVLSNIERFGGVDVSTTTIGGFTVLADPKLRAWMEAADAHQKSPRIPGPKRTRSAPKTAEEIAALRATADKDRKTRERLRRAQAASTAQGNRTL